MKRTARAVLWLITGVFVGAAAVQYRQAVLGWPLAIVALIPAVLAWTLDHYKQALEIRKLHGEIAKLSREAKRDRESGNLVQRAPQDLPKSFATPYKTRDLFIRTIQEKERINARFNFETSDDES